MPTFLTCADVAQAMGLTPGAIRLMARRGELPVAAKTVRGVLLFMQDDVDLLVAARRARARRAD